MSSTSAIGGTKGALSAFRNSIARQVRAQFASPKIAKQITPGALNNLSKELSRLNARALRNERVSPRIDVYA